MSVLASPDKFRKIWGYKYVRFADGEVLFCDAADKHVSHKHVVDERAKAQGDSAVPPVSAGTIKVKGKAWE